MPSAAVSRLIRAPQRDVWTLLSDVSQSRRWNKYWTSIELTSPQTHGTGTTFRTKTESGDTFDFRICDWAAPERIAFCPIRDPNERYGITLDSHVFEVKAVSDEESEVTITARASAHGVRGRIVALFFWAGHQRDGLNSALDSIQRVFQPELFKDEAAGQNAHEPLPE